MEGVQFALVLQIIDRVEFLLFEIERRRVLNEVAAVVPLGERHGGSRVVVVVEYLEGPAEGVLVFRGIFIRRYLNAPVWKGFRDITEAAHDRRVFPCPEAPGKLYDGPFAHAVEEKVRLRVEKDRAPYAVRPEVVMRDPPEARLYAAEDDWPGGLP